MALTKITGEGIGTTSGNLTVDVAGDIILDADGGDVTIKDGGTSIGAISNTSSDLSIYSTASGHSGIRFHENGILPTNNAGALIDNDAVLGDASYRYTNLFLSGGVYLGGTGSANLLSDYEEGTWTPTVNSGTITIETNSSKYIKVGNLVTVYTRIHSFSDNTSSNELILKTLPFTISTTNPEANIGSAWGRDVGDHRSMFFYPQVNSTTALAYYGGAGGTFNQVIHSDFNSSTDIIIRLHYITA